MPILSSDYELELRNPGVYTLEWLQDNDEDLTNYEFLFVSSDSVDLLAPTDTLYLIKWRNLSYKQATWEHISNLNMPASKLNEFR